MYKEYKIGKKKYFGGGFLLVGLLESNKMTSLKIHIEVLQLLS